jgi:hypothetical protein
MASLLRVPDLRCALSKAALALDVFLWLWALPLRLRARSIPAVLERLADGSRAPVHSTLEIQQVAHIVALVCNLRPFRSRLFPQRCLRQSLALYRTLLRFGHPLRIHFGVRKDSDALIGHSWVTCDGTAVADTTCSALFKTAYSHGSRAQPSQQSTGQ